MASMLTKLIAVIEVWWSSVISNNDSTPLRMQRNSLKNSLVMRIDAVNRRIGSEMTYLYV